MTTNTSLSLSLSLSARGECAGPRGVFYATVRVSLYSLRYNNNGIPSQSGSGLRAYPRARTPFGVDSVFVACARSTRPAACVCVLVSAWIPSCSSASRVQLHPVHAHRWQMCFGAIGWSPRLTRDSIHVRSRVVYSSRSCCPPRAVRLRYRR
jgi:hypothetical protein